MQTNRTSELRDLLSRRTVRVGLPGETRDDVIREIVQLLDGLPEVKNLEEVEAAVRRREDVMSTGVGKSLALPHAKTSAVTGTVAAFAVVESPIEWEAIDNEPVRLVFLLIGTESAKSQHIKILSRISRLMNRDEFRARLLEARDADDIIAAFEEGDLQLSEQG
jgi:mannitol/fructose-specific phosphotransferase system IIA component (Ntr-type)